MGGHDDVQAKHTNGYNRSFSEFDFFSAVGTNTVLAKEIPRIKDLRTKKQLDHYMLFANRRLSAIAESDIRAHISKTCDIPVDSIYLCGIEQLETFLKTFPEVPKLVKIDPVDSPLIVSPDDLAEIVEALARQKDIVSEALDASPVARVSYEEKNRRNNMSADYADALRRRYLRETAQIQGFLAAPENMELQHSYQSVVEEFEFKIIAKRKDHQTFDAVMEHLLDVLFSRDPVLRQRRHKRLTRGMLFYMYWNCDIGEVGSVETD